MAKNPKHWLERYERSKKVQAKVKEEAMEFKNSYSGKKFRKKGSRVYEDEMRVNFIYSYVEIVSPSLFSGNPKVIVKPKAPRFGKSAVSMQENINYWSRELGAAQEFKDALFDSFFGYAAIEVGWDYQTEIREEEIPGEMTVLPDGSPGMTAPTKVRKEYIKKDQPFLRWRNPWDVFLDVDVPRRKDGRFIIVRDVVTHDYFMGMSNIDPELKEKVKPTLRPEDSNDDSWAADKFKNKEVQSDKEWVELLWIWCRETEKRYLITPNLKDEYLLEEPWPYYLEFEDDPFPVTILDGKQDFASPYSFSEIRPVWDHIEERNRLRSASLIHMKRSIPKYIGTKANTRAQVSKLMNARSDEYTEMNAPDAIRLAPVAENPPELDKWDAIIKDDILNISGLFEFQANSIADTATEASLIEGRAAVRKKKRVVEFERFVTAVHAKLGMLCQQFQDQAVAIEIANNEDTSWMSVSKDQIQGEFRYEVEPGIMEYKNEALRKQQVLKFAEIMRGNPNVDQRKLAVNLAKVFDFSSADILVPLEQIQSPPPEPMIKFKDIDITTIPAPEVQSAILQTAMQQNNVQAAQPPVQDAPMQDGSMPPIQDETTPMGGKMPLPPVLGQQETQPMSEADTNFL